ncbi:MAG: nucleotidyl transferase AbiEii/AbiGii toxin family protein [Gammaproteobacteria bacterium]
MIDRQEVMDFAREFSLAPQVIEKAYVLGWVLAGIAAHPELAESWVFKGGTCLKKCYFETYRFSEDLDFTLTDPAQLDEKYLLRVFAEVSDWIKDQAGIDIPGETLRFDIYDNSRGNPSGLARLSYRGPLALTSRRDLPRIKLDLTNDEILVLEPVLREVHHPYSDKPASGIKVHCYAFEEVFAEKIRALAERERPRDLYDVIHLHRHDELRPNRVEIYTTLQRKCEFKRIAVPTFAQLAASPNRTELEAEWGNMLAHQLQALPEFEEFWQELPQVFEWLYGLAEKPARPVLQMRGPAVDEAWRPPSMGRAWNLAAPLETIRFAAANRLCVDLRYQDEQGRVSKRLIEPYSLRRTNDGNLLLYAVRHNSGEPRSYRVDRILGADTTNTSFMPRYQIELTPAGPLSAPSLSQSTSLPDFSARKPAGKTRIERPSSRRSSNLAGYGPKYVFQCTVCDKKFTRKKHNATLNPHKNKQGRDCPGRIGMYVETKY